MNGRLLLSSQMLFVHRPHTRDCSASCLGKVYFVVAFITGAACAQAAYLLAVLAEHHSTHQVISAQQAVPALLQVMHAACQPRTSSQTLDRPSTSRGLPSAPSADFDRFSCSTDHQPRISVQTADRSVSPRNTSSAEILTVHTDSSSTDNDWQLPPAPTADLSLASHAASSPAADAAPMTNPNQAASSGLFPASDSAESSVDAHTAANSCQDDTSTSSAATPGDSGEAGMRAGTDPRDQDDLMAAASSIAASVANTISGLVSTLTAAGLDNTAADTTDTAVTAGPASDPDHLLASTTSSDADSSPEQASAAAPDLMQFRELPHHAAVSISRLQQAAAMAAQQSHNGAAKGGPPYPGGAARGGAPYPATRRPSSTQLPASQTGPNSNLGSSRSRTNDGDHGHVGAGSSMSASAQDRGSVVQRRHALDAERLQRDRLLVAANAALLSLLDNADTHFGVVNEGAAPALVATLQHGRPHLFFFFFIMFFILFFFFFDFFLFFFFSSSSSFFFFCFFFFLGNTRSWLPAVTCRTTDWSQQQQSTTLNRGPGCGRSVPLYIRSDHCASDHCASDHAHQTTAHQTRTKSRFKNLEMPRSTGSLLSSVQSAVLLTALQSKALLTISFW